MDRDQSDGGRDHGGENPAGQSRPEDGDQDGWRPKDTTAFRASMDGTGPELVDVNDGVVRQFRSHGGRIVDGPFAGMRGLLLHTVGAKSGAPRVNPLYRFDFEGSWYVIGANGGSASTPAWVHNLRLAPNTRVEVGSGDAEVVAYRVTARELTEPRRGVVWGELRREIPHIDDFQSNTARLIPVFELTRVPEDDDHPEA